MSSSTPWLVTGQILLDSGIEYVSSRGVLLPESTIYGTVLEWGRVSKTISSTSAGPQTSDAVFRMKDPDRYWRDLSLSQTFRGRTVRLRFSIADADVLSAVPFWTGEIVSTTFGPGYIQITARDNSWSWMDEYVPPLLTAANFPYLISSSEGAFAKIIFGDVNDSGVDGAPISSDKFGAIQLDHLGPVAGIDRYCVARHTIYDIEVYRKASGDTAFSAVDPSEYSVTVENLLVDGYTYEMTFVDFLVDQSNAVITANVKGLYFRPAVTGYEAEGYDPVLNPAGTPGELHNPIDAFLNFMRIDCRKALSFDYDAIMAIRDTFEAVPLVIDGTAAYDCSGVINETETRRAILSKFLPCFLLDMFHNRLGEITLNFSGVDSVAVPLYSDRMADGVRNLILRESFTESDPSPIANRCILPALRHYASGIWLWTGSYENFYDQSSASVPERDSSDVVTGSRDPRIEPVTAEFWFCRDATTIYDVAARRMAFMSLSSYQQEYNLPMPEVIDELEMCKLVFLTHGDGLSSGGYDRIETKVIGLNYDLREFIATVSSVRRNPGVVLGSDTVIYGSATLSFGVEIHADSSDLAYSFIVSTSEKSSNSHWAVTPAVDTTGANLLVAAVADYASSLGSDVTDNYGNVWIPLTKYSNLSSGLEEIQLYYSLPTGVGPFHVFQAAETDSGSPSQPSIAVAAFSNSAVSPFDVESGNYLGSSGPSINPGSITPSEDGELIITAIASDAAITSPSIDSGFTIIENQSQVPAAYGISLAYKIQSTAAAINPLWDSGLGALDMAASIASFKAS